MSGPARTGQSAAAVSAALVGLRCHISEQAYCALGVEPLAGALGRRLGIEPRLIGTSAVGGLVGASCERELSDDWAADLAAARGCLLEAGGQLEDALAAGRMPLLVAGDCALALGTLPVLGRLRPDARVLWLDAHGDFNTPQTSPGGWLGGMALSGACGAWDSGLGSIDAERVVLCGVRDLDEGERGVLDNSDATVIGASLETLVYLVHALDGAPVYVHLDPDVLDPELFPAGFPAPGGLTPEKLFDLLDAVADSCELVGVEFASFYCPPDPHAAADAIELLVDAVSPLLTRDQTGEEADDDA